MRELSDDVLKYQAHLGLEHVRRGGDWSVWLESKKFTPEDQERIEALRLLASSCAVCDETRESHRALFRRQWARIREHVAGDVMADRVVHALSDVEQGTCAECYKPLATESDETESTRHKADGGCECGRCMAVCWTSYGGQCEAWE